MTLVADKHQLDTKYRLLRFVQRHTLSSGPVGKLVYLRRAKKKKRMKKKIKCANNGRSKYRKVNKNCVAYDIKRRTIMAKKYFF